MSTAWGGGGGGGGGGGFGGFPYRSAHQQGADRRGGRGRGRGGRGQQRGGRRPSRTRRTPHSLLYAADLTIPADRRGCLIGKGGTVIKEMRERTGATIYVPNQGGDYQGDIDQRPVRVKAESIASLLHACWRIVQLGIALEEAAPCQIRVPSNATSLCGRLERRSQFLIGEANGMSAFCIESFLDVDEVGTLVDNERFANPHVTAHCETVHPQVDRLPSTLLFVYGDSEQHPEQLARALQESTTILWRRRNIEDCTPVQHKLPVGAITVGTYNLLYPAYAKRYSEQSGLDRSGQCNWVSFRAPAIARILLQHNLDIYLLQEVSIDQLLEIPDLTHQYEFVHFLHPGRDGDSVAILLRRSRFVIQHQVMVPFNSKQDPSQHYMCAATALIQDTTTNLRYLVASTHFYTKKALYPEATLLEYLDTHRSECDAVIWGGDCNDEYKGSSYPQGYRTAANDEGDEEEEGQGRYTRGQKRIDWIFVMPNSNNNMKCSRTDASEAFVEATKNKLDPTGYPPSDHYGEALVLSPLPVEKQS